MPGNVGIGIQIASADPFWVMVREAAAARALQLGLRIVALDLDLVPLEGDEQLGWLEELLAQDLNALVLQGISPTLARPILEAGLPLVIASETDVHHPLATCTQGLYNVALQIGGYVGEGLGGQGRVLIVGGLMEGFEVGRSRLRGCLDALGTFPGISVAHVPTPWLYDQASQHLSDVLPDLDFRPDALIGLSDPTALAARDVGQRLGLVGQHTLVAGFNGDPLAVAAILEGAMEVSADLYPSEVGRMAVDLAYQAGMGLPLPARFACPTRLITRANATAAATEKMLALAALPSRLAGYSRDLELRRLTELRTSLAIGQQIESTLDGDELRRRIAGEIRANYGYDDVRIYLWSDRDKQFVPDLPGEDAAQSAPIPLATSGLLSYTLLRNRPTFIPDARRSARFPPDPSLPDCRSRVILPIRCGTQLLGLLDLRSRHSRDHSHLDLIGLQVLSEKFGLALRNAELYDQALAERASAQRANQIKSRLLANVSHELRTPVNIIQGYSQAALGAPNPYGVALPAELSEDLKHICASAEHLGRLINDLIDMARAEIDELEIIPAEIAPAALVQEVFAGFTGSLAPSVAVAWRLELPAELPSIQADALRLRQILLNLLSNAAKFTAAGHVTLGAAVEAPNLHLWVEDTGCGIAADLQARIFEAFATAEGPRRPGQGIGLGLRLTHELVRLHGGTISVASRERVGTTFHVFLPLDAERVTMAAPPLPDQPASPLNPSLPPGAKRVTRQAIAYLREHYADNETRAEIAGRFGVSESYLTRVFRRDLGFTPWEYITRCRIEQAKDLLSSSQLTVTEVGYQVGYNDAAYFTRVFHKETGQSPLAFRRHTR